MVRSLPLLLFDSLLVTHSHTLALVLLTWQTVWPWLPQMNKRLPLVLYSHVRSSVPSPKIPLPSPCQPSHPLKPHKRQHNSSFILKSTVQFYYWIIKKNRRLSFKNKHNNSLGHINKKRPLPWKTNVYCLNERHWSPQTPSQNRNNLFSSKKTENTGPNGKNSGLSNVAP